LLKRNNPMTTAISDVSSILDRPPWADENAQVLAPPRPIRRPSVRPVSLADRRLEEGRPLVAAGGNLSPAYRVVKRTLDVLGALAILAVLSPVMLAVLLVLTVTTRGKPLFGQLRSGYLGRPFWMLKFRTMALDADNRQHEVANEKDGPIFKNRRDPRITRLGRILRKTSLDETPQLFHVLMGRMSLVGPRPLPLKETAKFEAWHRRRLAVMPGLTCLWQIAGRSEIDFTNWMRLDIRYVNTQSLLTDCKLLLCTPWCVIRGRGAY